MGLYVEEVEENREEVIENQFERNEEYFNNLKEKSYSVGILNSNFKAKFIEDALILFSKRERSLISIPYNNMLNVYSYSIGGFSRKIEVVFLFLLFAGSLYLIPGVLKIVLGSLFGFLFLYPFIFSGNFIILKVKMETEKEEGKSRPIITTFKFNYSDVEFVKKIKNHVKFYHSFTRLFR